MAQNDTQSDNATIEKTDTGRKTARPQQYNSVVLNDDFTPIDFVVGALMDVFNHEAKSAVAIAINIHKTGRGVAGTFTLDEAMTRNDIVMEMAREQGYPLLMTYEPAL